MKRVLTAAVGVPLVLAATGWAPNWLFAALLALVATASLNEFFELEARRWHDRPGRWFLPFGGAVTLAFAWTPKGIAGTYVAAVLVLAVASVGSGQDQTWRRLCEAGAGIFYTCVLLGLLIWIPRGAVFVLLAIIWAGDSLAFYVGRWIGRHPLAPRISPNKTIEGAVAGLVGSLLVGVTLGQVLLELPAMFLGILSLLTAAAGQLGDLAESALKRKAGVKDSGSLLPGHGGVLDRIDSLLAATPVFFLIGTLR